MTGMYEHIHPEFRHVMALSSAERIEFMDFPRWVGYPTAQKILDTLQGLMHKPQRSRMPNLLIVGDPNNGKTTILERFEELCGQAYVDENSEPVKPLLVCQSPPYADEKSFYCAILQRFFTPYNERDTPIALRAQVLHLCRACKVRMIAFDEMHSMLTGTALKQREVMNVIKYLCNELKIPIVGFGTRDAVRVLHHDPQHASRFDVVKVPLWDLDKNFQQLLASFEKILPLQKPSDIHRPELCRLIHTISEGNLGNVHRLLTECAREAIETGKEAIDKSLIESKSWLRPTRGIREQSL